MTSFRRFRHPILYLLVGFALFAPVFAGDKDVADLLCEKGEKAARARKYEEAVGHFRRALEEHSPHPDAAFGLAKALDKLGRTGEAVEAYLLCLDGLKREKTLSRSQKRIEKQAKKAVKKLGKGYAELAKLDEEFVSDCVALGKKHFNGSREWSRKAFETALLIEPGNELAKSYMERLQHVVPPAEVGGLFEPLIEGDKLDNWNPGLKTPWKLVGGILSADFKKGAVSNFCKTFLKGNYSFRGTFRQSGKDYGKLSYGLMFGRKADTSAWGLFVSWDETVCLVRFTGSGTESTQSKIVPGLVPTRWMTLRVTIDGKNLTAYGDGKKLLFYEAKEDDAFDGAPGVFIQRCQAEARNVELQR